MRRSTCGDVSSRAPVTVDSDPLSEVTPAPTREQQAVVDAPEDRAMLVLAGPGTGKTFTLIRRVSRLLEQGQQPLILSFTRAVVRELHQRFRVTQTEAARYLRPVTFD